MPLASGTVVARQGWGVLGSPKRYVGPEDPPGLTMPRHRQESKFKFNFVTCSFLSNFRFLLASVLLGLMTALCGTCLRFLQRHQVFAELLVRASLEPQCRSQAASLTRPTRTRELVRTPVTNSTAAGFRRCAQRGHSRSPSATGRTQEVK